mgnify:CR=1 FL=1
MKKRYLPVLYTIALLVFPAQTLSAGDIRVGAAAVKITPPQGAPMAGYYYNRQAEGVHDDLFAKALVFEEGETLAATVVELANGSVGYAPNRKAYPEGAYEVISARCGPGSGELLVDTATRILVDLHRNARTLQEP